MVADELSTTIPLVPPVTGIAAAGSVAVPHDEETVMSKNMMHPTVFGGQFMGLPATLKKSWSVLVLALLNPVIGEQATLALVSVGPRIGVLMTMLFIGICHSALTVLWVLQTYKFPVPGVL